MHANRGRDPTPRKGSLLCKQVSLDFLLCKKDTFDVLAFKKLSIAVLIAQFAVAVLFPNQVKWLFY